MKAIGTKNKSRGLRSIMVAMPREGNLDIDSITCKMCMSVCFLLLRIHETLLIFDHTILNST